MRVIFFFWIFSVMASACGVKGPPLPPVVANPADSESISPQASPSPADR